MPNQDFLHSLNVQQQKAVLHTEGPLLLLAGAGTGKTKVLTSRIANIIHQNLASPQNILAVTFTNKAAKEMQERVHNLVSSYGLNIGTFHSMAARILRDQIEHLNLGLNSRFTIISQDDQLRLIKDIVKLKNIDTKKYAPKLIHIVISRWKDQGLLPNKLSSSDTNLPLQRVAKLVYEEYQQNLLISNVVDFGDLLLYNNELFIKNPEILKYYQEKYRYILIDEYQDTNVVQYLWARMLASLSKNICCVGDDDQSIYGWRGAEVGNILRFEKDFLNATIIKLEQNYRSTLPILAAASNVINNNKNRHGKTLWTDKESGEKIKIISCWNDKEEARYIASEIARLVREGRYSAGNIAILVRAGFQTRSFEEAFINSAMPYKIIGGLRFYERMEIRDVLAYIRIALNQNDNLALERIINVPKRAIGAVTLNKIKAYAIEKNISNFVAIKEMLEDGEIKTKSYETLKDLVTKISNWHERFSFDAPINVTKAILDDSGYLEMLQEEKTEEALGRIENINEMLRAIAEFNDIHDFIEHSSLVMENEVLETNYGGSVTIMTLHGAKGLEFDVVFLPGWEEGVFPSQRSLDEEGEKGLEEERRIAYVGITRAKKELYITHAESRKIFYEIVRSYPSRFLAEIPEEIIIRTSSIKKYDSFYKF
ncbi:ATP-dependent DNA helicase PcrA [Rickettsia sp. MEAM1 (Bemisia tabaci)]|uniref:DNA helicase PcrA n=1 Tax=unclassified Rickettsia TaxID=114295 RepID=UPI0002EB0A40|nr:MULTISPECIES: DNA helicase PcrA [unclassified Rickettsia]ASX28520.1 ATP-dependent DNA helicase PcrA [Rickettsia sp. MEAM1 (Bemisia tabaci)]ODA38004.1 ATP-dependent DNA helicase PcrA [Rickettsia sp. wb]ODA38626.1 ATP-dependent DNA helicase PcrA [Rickettsia sp. wq]